MFLSCVLTAQHGSPQSQSLHVPASTICLTRYRPTQTDGLRRQAVMKEDKRGRDTQTFHLNHKFQDSGIGVNTSASH